MIFFLKKHLLSCIHLGNNTRAKEFKTLFVIIDQLSTYLEVTIQKDLGWKENVVKRLFLYSHTFSKILLLA